MKKNIVGIILFILVTVFLVVFYLNNNLSYQLEKNSIGLDVDGFKLKELTENKIFAEKDSEILKIEIIKNINQSKADEYIENQIALLEGIFEPQLPPYPEFLTKQTGCEDKYKPQEKISQYGKYFMLYSGIRFGYGICIDDLIEYKASLGYFYCQNENTLFKIEYFIEPDDDFNKIINLNDSFVCKL